MALVFDPVTDDQPQGTNRADLGPGRATAAGVALQGFFVSYSGADHHVNVIEANTATAFVSDLGGDVIVTYDFRCEMIDHTGHHSTDNRLRSVVIANVTSTGVAMESGSTTPGAATP